MTRALRSLEQVMSKNTALTLDQVELHPLQDETLRLERDDNGDDYDENDQDDSHKRGLVRVVERYRASQVSPADSVLISTRHSQGSGDKSYRVMS